MSRRRRIESLAVMAVAVTVTAAGASRWAEACGAVYTLRAYLNPAFWQAFPVSHRDMIVPRAAAEPAVAFAGRSPAPAPETITRFRRAYSRCLETRGLLGMTADQAAVASADRDLLAALEAAAPSAPREVADEIALIRLKVALYDAAKGHATSDIAGIRDRLRSFVTTTSSPALRSEARGWLARTHYLLGERPDAALLYIDEADDPSSVLDTGILTSSLRMLYGYNGAANGLADDLPRFLDTPRHALYAARLLTNPLYGGADMEQRRLTGRRVLETLEPRADLFHHGPDSDALALVLMRAALHAGDPDAALRYAGRVSPSASATEVLERHWMSAVAFVLTDRLNEADAELHALVRSPVASVRDRGGAWHALVGVYQRRGDGAGQLVAALHFADAADGKESTDEWNWQPVPWPSGAAVMDVPYLLDILTTDAELRQARRLLAAERQPPRYLRRWTQTGPVRVPAVSVVDYALAIRAARGRHFDLASRLFDRVGEHTRAERMRRAGRLYAAASAPGARPDARLEWARFVAGHPERLFTHGYAWWGLQRYMLLTRYDAPLPAGYFETQLSMLRPEERQRLETREREFRDAQEERWQAYLVARHVAGEPMSTPATVRAALRLAIDCLDRINTDRFGRAREIDRDKATLVARLRSLR